MSEHAVATEQGEETQAPEPQFTDEEIAQFDRDDSYAGSAIGRMLALFFLYTVLVMSFVSWLTYFRWTDH